MGEVVLVFFGSSPAGVVYELGAVGMVAVRLGDGGGG